jgi:hypothetical protein
MKGDCKCGTSHGPAEPKPERKRIIYEYKDESGNTLFRVVRWYKDGKKQFSQNAPDGSGGWKKNRGNARLVPFRFPELLAADPSLPVYIAEGEKDVLTLVNLGFVATCNPGGTGAGTGASWIAINQDVCRGLTGRDVIIYCDVDTKPEKGRFVGFSHALHTYNSISQVTKSTRIFHAPEPHKDVTDLIEAGGTIDQMVEISLQQLQLRARVQTTNQQPPATPPAAPAQGGAWLSSLVTRIVRKQTVTPPIVANAATILSQHNAWNGIIAYDAFAETVITLKVPPWDPIDMPSNAKPGKWTDADTARAVSWLSRNVGIDFSVSTVECAIQIVSESTVIHPVCDYLKSLKWDNVCRLDDMLSKYFGARDCDYVRGVGRRWMISAVARVMRPGCQVDCTLILEGNQGIGKTSAFRALVPVSSWYADTGIDITKKDSLEALRSVWIYGLDELDSVRVGADLTRWKNFLTQTRDHYRPSYGRRARDYERQNIFCGTTNETEDYFSDSTGNRRFWPVRIIDIIDVAALAAVRDQLWAEAYTRFMAGETYHVDDPHFRQLCEDEQNARMHEDPWTSRIIAWLERPFSLSFGPNGFEKTDVDVTEGFMACDIAAWALRIPIGQLKKKDETRITSVLKKIGYERGAMERLDGTRVRRWKRVVRGVVTEVVTLSSMVNVAVESILSPVSPAISGFVNGNGAGEITRRSQKPDRGGDTSLEFPPKESESNENSAVTTPSKKFDVSDIDLS